MNMNAFMETGWTLHLQHRLHYQTGDWLDFASAANGRRAGPCKHSASISKRKKLSRRLAELYKHSVSEPRGKRQLQQPAISSQLRLGPRLPLCRKAVPTKRQRSRYQQAHQQQQQQQQQQLWQHGVYGSGREGTTLSNSLLGALRATLSVLGMFRYSAPATRQCHHLALVALSPHVLHTTMRRRQNCKTLQQISIFFAMQ